MFEPKGRLALLTSVLLASWLPAAGEPLAGEGKGVSGAGRPVRVDRYGDPLPPGAVARLGTTRFRHAGWPWVVAVSPDGRWLASHEQGSVVCLWDADTGKLGRRLRGHTGRIHCLAYAPDSKAVASGSDDRTFRVWDAATGRELGRFRGEPPKRPSGYSPFGHVLFSPDGKALVTHGDDNVIRLWDIATGKEVRRFTGYQDLVWQVALARDGKTLAALLTPPGIDRDKGPDEVWVWEVATGKQLRRWPIRPRQSISAFSPDLDLLVTRPAAWPPYELTVWDVARGQRLRTLPDARDAAFSADGKTLLTYGASICLWDLATGKELRRVKHPRPGEGGHIALCPDGKTLVAYHGAKNLVRFYDATTGRELRRFDGHEAGVRAVAFSPDGKLVVSGALDEVRVWDVAGQKAVRQFALATTRGSDFLTGLALAPDGKTLFVLANSGLHVWDVAGGPKPGLPVPPDRPRRMAVSPDGKAVVTWGDRGEVALWDPRSWKPLRKWDLGDKWIPAAAFSPDGKTLCASAGGDGQIALLRWEVATGRPLPALGKPARGVNALAYSADGRLLATVEWFTTIRFWETATGELRAVAEMTDNVHALAFSPDGRFLATANAGGFRRASKDGNEGNSDIGKVCLVDVGSGRVAHRLAGHRGGVAGLAFSPDGRLLASGGNDTTVLLWDMAAVPVPRRPGAPPAPAELEALWADLAGSDGVKAHHAVWALARSAEVGVPFLKERLRPAAPADAKAVARWLDDLDNARGAVRERASRELERLAELAGPALRRALAEPRSLELRRRVELLLAKLDAPVRLPETRRALRAVEALEHAGTPQARALLEALAAGAPEVRQTRQAQAALARLARRASP